MLSKESYEDDMRWANEIRHVTVMFVNLGLQEHNLLAAADARQRDAMEQVGGVGSVGGCDGWVSGCETNLRPPRLPSATNRTLPRPLHKPHTTAALIID